MSSVRRLSRRRSRRTAELARLLAGLDELAAIHRPRPVRRIARVALGRPL
jgi:hypothetical protein